MERVVKPDLATTIASAFVQSFEAQLTAHIVGGFPAGAVMSTLTPEQLAAVRTLVTQAARNAGGAVALEIEEDAEEARKEAA